MRQLLQPWLRPFSVLAINRTKLPPPQPEIASVQFVGVTALDVVTRAEAKPYAADFNVFIPGVTAATKLVKFSADAWTVDGDPILVDRTGGTLVAWAPSALAVTTSASGAEYTLTAQKDAAAQDLIYQPQPVNAANANAKLPLAYSENGYVSTLGIEDGSYLRLNTLTLGYTLPKSMLQKAGISNLRVYGSIYNVFTITGYSGIDAEVSTSTSTKTYPQLGMDWGTYPRARSFVLGVNLSF